MTVIYLCILPNCRSYLDAIKKRTQNSLDLTSKSRTLIIILVYLCAPFMWRDARGTFLCVMSQIDIQGGLSEKWQGIWDFQGGRDIAFSANIRIEYWVLRRTIFISWKSDCQTFSPCKKRDTKMIEGSEGRRRESRFYVIFHASQKKTGSWRLTSLTWLPAASNMGVNGVIRPLIFNDMIRSFHFRVYIRTWSTY